MLEIAPAGTGDLDRIMEIYRIAQDYMIATGNPTQWGHEYPSEALVRQDIAQGVCHVISGDGVIHGVFALIGGEDPSYARIDGGAWRNGEPYLTIHRIAGDGAVHGLFRCAAEYAKALSDNVRVDTHENNRTMQRLIEANGFVRCGIVYMLEDSSPRIAYHWVR